jgi:hypothetical protein
MAEIDAEISPLSYATPAPVGGSGVAAGIGIMVGGLGLIFLGGCFCIGIMISLNIGNLNGGGSTAAGPGHAIFIAVLYMLAFACFGSAVLVLLLGIRKLLAIGRS